MNNLGERLYTLRTNKEMSQGDLAEKLDVSRQTVSKWENNMSIPELDKIIALSEVFGVSVDYIVKGESESPETVPTQNKESEYKTTAESVPVRMITVDPTKKMITGLSLGVGIVFLFTVVINSFNIITNIMYGVAANQIIVSIVSIGLYIFACASLISGKLNLLSVYYIIYSIYSLLIIIINASISFTGVFNIIAYILIALMYFTGNKKNSKFILAFTLVALVVNFILQGANYVYIFADHGMTIRSIINSVINSMSGTIPTLVMNIGSAYLMFLRANPKSTYEITENAAPEYDDMYVGIVKHILLTLFTFGIYDCYWVYKTTENLNCNGVNEFQSGTKKLLLCIFVPFYRIFWFYAQAKRLENLMREKEMHYSDFAIVTLILAIFVPIAAPNALLQVKINEYAEF